MSALFDAWWRAFAYCLHPRLILLSLMPVLLAGALGSVLAWFYWEAAVEGVRTGLGSIAWLHALTTWLDDISAGAFRSVIGPLVVVVLAVPVVVLLTLLLVSWLMGAAVARRVAERRFPTLERRQGGSLGGSLLRSVAGLLLALVVLALTMPLWLIPPFALVLPPLIWGWLTYRVMSYDALADHASAEERHALLRQHRWPLLAMGLTTGYLSAAPSLIWVTSALMLPMMPLLLPGFIWLYTLVFAFACAWFSHYCLAALTEARRTTAVPEPVPSSAPEPVLPNGTLPLPPF